MIQDRHLLDAALRQNLYFFVRKAFGTLHPGQDFIPANLKEEMERTGATAPTVDNLPAPKRSLRNSL